MAKTVKKVEFNTLLSKAVEVPFVKIHRDEFLREQLQKHYDAEVVEKAIQESPAAAGIPVKEMDKIANHVIRWDTARTTTIASVAGIPGGFAMIGTIPLDFVQNYAYMLRVMQKLLYLYGWQDLFDENGKLDEEIRTLVTLFTGVMFGVDAAAKTITKISVSAEAHVAKVIAGKALTKGTIYPIVKKVAAMLGYKMTKEVFAKGVSKIVPVVGGAVSGGLTLATFVPMAIRLRKHLASLPFADPEKQTKEMEPDVVEVDFSDLDSDPDVIALDRELEKTKQAEKAEEGEGSSSV